MENVIITFSSKFENQIKGVTMTERRYRHSSPCDRARVLCEEQLLFVVGKELFGKLQYILCACLFVLICLSAHDSLTAQDECMLTQLCDSVKQKKKI